MRFATSCEEKAVPRGIGRTIYHDEQRENGVQDTDEYKTSSQPEESHQSWFQDNLVNDARCCLSGTHSFLKQISHQKKLEVPLQGMRKCPAFAPLWRQPGIEWQMQSQGAL